VEFVSCFSISHVHADIKLTHLDDQFKAKPCVFTLVRYLEINLTH